MQFATRALVAFVLAAFVLTGFSQASVVFKPGKKPQYVGPGGEDEEIHGDSAELFQIGQTAEKEGDTKRAIRAYKTLVKRHPRDKMAAEALYRAAVLQEREHLNFVAAETFAQLVEKYPGSPHFDEAIEAQFRIGEIYLHGKKLRFLGVPVASALDRAVTVFANVVRTAPYGKYTARAQFDIGLAREKQGANDAAVQAYQAVVDKFPNEPVAVDAQYQIGYIWFNAAQLGTKDAAAATSAKTAFEDFLLHYPKSEKAPQARANLAILEHKQTTNSYKVAKFYDKQKYYRAAVIYYNEVIRQQPGSQESNEAKKRIDQLRAKYGDAALQPALPLGQQAAKKKSDAQGARTAETGSAKPGAPNNEAPLPASDADSSLPPPASLAPDTTTAPAPDPLLVPPGTGTNPSTNSSADPLPSPDESAPPAASASPAP
ncbi:MAG TPA: outer membrane protein assembly factor BamD [Candidatus Udaeobacter sp.]|jgi:outer membrane protein assembly factor BamD|nr:outer membrane protein assembly factor BamD [Candidatus Udaeobacter sp.]